MYLDVFKSWSWIFIKNIIKMNAQQRPSIQGSKNRAIVDQTDGNIPLRVNFENVVKQGILTMKGKILRLYNNECMFYLEKSRKILVEGSTNEF